AHLKTLAIDPRDANRLYAGVEQGALLLSTNGGESWRELDGYARPDDEVYKDIHLVMLRPSNPDEIYMTGGMGLYHSPDKGETWTHLSNRQARVGYPDQFQFSPADDRTIFMAGAALNPGTWRQSHCADSTVVSSRDGGHSWEEASTGLPEHMVGNIEAMALSGDAGGFELFAGTTDGEVYASPDGAATWSRIAAGLAPVSKGGHYVPLQAPAA
ncbi:MAG TPA: glycosyl hydrolase, partial [Dehalococcoidia bacterium]|nr:glycosyl hydrolase [Dehalococcoidia bacterium]